MCLCWVTVLSHCVRTSDSYSMCLSWGHCVRGILKQEVILTHVPVSGHCVRGILHMHIDCIRRGILKQRQLYLHITQNFQVPVCYS